MANAVELARMNADEVSDVGFSAKKVMATINRSIEKADPTIFVAEQDGALIGFIVCEICGYYFGAGIFVSQQVLYVRPDKRGSRAAVKLIDEFIRWGQVLKAREYFAGTSTGIRPEQFARMFEKRGFERVGFSMKRVAP